MVGICCRLLLLVLLMTGCGSSRKAQQTNTELSVQTETDIRQSVLQGTGIRLTDLVKKDMTIHFRWVKYDTDKAPDAEGNYPKAGEGSGEVGFQADGVTDIVLNDSTRTDTEMQRSGEAEAKERSQNESERKETDIFDDMIWLIIAIVILLLAICFVRFLSWFYKNK